MVHCTHEKGSVRAYEIIQNRRTTTRVSVHSVDRHGHTALPIIHTTRLAFCYLFLQNLQSLFEKLLGLEGASALYREDKVVLDQVNLDAIGPFRIVDEIANSCCQASRSRIRYDRDLIERNT